jgi:hypothetical protein
MKTWVSENIVFVFIRVYYKYIFIMMENDRNIYYVQLSVALLGIMNKSTWDLRYSWP